MKICSASQVHSVIKSDNNEVFWIVWCLRGVTNTSSEHATMVREMLQNSTTCTFICNNLYLCSTRYIYIRHQPRSQGFSRRVGATGGKRPSFPARRPHKGKALGTRLIRHFIFKFNNTHFLSTSTQIIFIQQKTFVQLQPKIITFNTNIFVQLQPSTN